MELLGQLDGFDEIGQVTNSTLKKSKSKPHTNQPYHSLPLLTDLTSLNTSDFSKKQKLKFLGKNHYGHK